MSTALLELEHVERSFLVGHARPGRARQGVRAVCDVSLRVGRTESFGLVGESGCGKTTLGRLVAGLDTPGSGSIKFSGEAYPKRESARRRLLARKVQMVFQDPQSSLNPRHTAQQLLARALNATQPLARPEAEARIAEALELVGLEAHAVLGRYPHELSGGQAQRLSLARALLCRPELLVLDEALSSLDVSIQAKVLRLLHELRHKLGLSYLFIGHDLGVIEVLCERIAVMYLGSIVEQGSTRQVLERPRHPYTRALLSAVPVLGRRRAPLALVGEPPSPLDPPSGCPFRTRCPRAEARCAELKPSLDQGPQAVACHFPLHGETGPDA